MPFPFYSMLANLGLQLSAQQPNVASVNFNNYPSRQQSSLNNSGRATVGGQARSFNLSRYFEWITFRWYACLVAGGGMSGKKLIKMTLITKHRNLARKAVSLRNDEIKGETDAAPFRAKKNLIPPPQDLSRLFTIHFRVSSRNFSNDYRNAGNEIFLSLF